MYTENTWKNNQFYNFNYLQYLPKDINENKKYPLVLFLHGAGERGDDLDLVAMHGFFEHIKHGKDYPFICIAPQCPNKKYWGCFMESLKVFLDDMCYTLPVDENRIYLTGLSMGGTGTFMLAMANPDKFAAIAPICGSGIVWYAEALKEIPVFMWHGDCDEIVPISESVTMLSKINKCGGNAQLKILYGVGHNAWDYAFDGDELSDWLLSHKKNNSLL